MYTNIVLLLCIALVLIKASFLSENLKSNASPEFECLINIINENLNGDKTLVNVRSDDLIRNMQKPYDFKVSIRSFLSLELHVDNEAYLIICGSYEDLKNGIKDLTKDYFWNPKASFVVSIDKITRNEAIEFFKLSHNIFVFNVILVDNINIDNEKNEPKASNIIFFYDFQIQKSCSFSKEAVKTTNCGSKDYLKTLLRKIFFNKNTLRSTQRRLSVPYSNCFLKFFMNPLIPYNFPTKNGDVEIIGYDEAFYQVMTDKGYLNFTLIHSSKPQQIGQPSKKFEVTGLMKLIQNGTIDGMVGAIILSKNRIGPFDFVYPHATDRFLVLLPRPSQIEKWRVMFFTFSQTVWILIVIAFNVVFISALVLKAFGRKSLRDPILILFVTFGYFVGATYKIDTAWKAKFLIVTWAIFTWLISCFYQSDLTSVFTKPHRYPNVESLKHLVKLDYELHMNKVTYNYINTTKVFLYDYGVINDAKLCEDRIDCLNNVAEGGNKYTIVTEKYYLFYQKAFLDGNYQSLFSILEEQHPLFMTAFVRKGHPDIERMRYMQTQFISSGLYKKQLLDLTFNNSLKYHYNETNGLNPLSIKDIEGLYYFFIGGCMVSFCVFIFEIVLYKGHNLGSYK